MGSEIYSKDSVEISRLQEYVKTLKYSDNHNLTRSDLIKIVKNPQDCFESFLSKYGHKLSFELCVIIFDSSEYHLSKFKLINPQGILNFKKLEEGLIVDKISLNL